METLRDYLNQDFLDNAVWLWASALGVALALFLVLLAVRFVIASRVRKLASKTTNKLDDIAIQVVGATNSLFLLAISILAGASLLDLGENETYLRRIVVVTALVQGGLWAMAFLRGWIEYWSNRRKDSASNVVSVIGGFLGKLVVWSIVLALALENLGIDVTALVAGLGVGGIAVALAAQSILGDLFASLSIVLDKPFAIGDFVIVGDMMGTVERIGLKTTRIRSLGGEELVFGNADLLSSRVRNYKRMNERRILFGFGVVYQTPVSQVEQISGWVRQIIDETPDTRFDRAHFKGFGASSLDYEVVYYMKVPDYNAYMDAQQAINLAICRKFESEGVEFAYPTQTLYVVSQGGKAPQSAGT